METGPVGRRITAGDQHDGGRIRGSGELLGHGEPIQIRQLDVEQDNLGPQDGDSTHRLRSIGRFTDDVEALGLEQRSGRGSEGRMVVDDEHRWTHAADRATGHRRGTLWPAAVIA